MIKKWLLKTVLCCCVIGVFILNTNLLTQVSASGDWTNISGGMYYNGGNVGIGTSTPSTMLALKGLVPDSYDIGIAQKYLGGTAAMEFTTADSVGTQATRLMLRGHADQADVEFYSGNKNAPVQTMIIKGTTGNLGVGTSNPLTRLEVDQGYNGGIILKDNLNANAAGKRTFRINEERGILYFQALTDDATVWQGNLLALDHDGSVCIGACN